MIEHALQTLTVGEVVRRAAAAHPDRIAIEDGATRLTYRALDAARLHAAAAFHVHGIRHGDRVAIWAPNGHAWITAALGLQSLGAALVPVNTRFKGAEAAQVLARSEARLLLTVGDFLGTRYPDLLRDRPLPALERTLLLDDGRDAESWSAFLARAKEVDTTGLSRELARVGPDDPSDILFTSGTTGQPKGVVTTHRQNIETFLRWLDLVGLREDDRYLVATPFFHTFGYKAGWLAGFLRGCTILPHAVFDSDQVLARVAQDRITVLPGPPTLYQSLLQKDLSAHDLSSLRLAVTGGSSVPVSLVERMRKELGFQTVLTGYGLTETCGVATMTRVEDDAQTVATTSGRALDGVEVACFDGAGARVPVGTPGEIWIRGFNVMRGYLDDPAATTAVLDDQGWLRTGDIGVQDARGYVQITDRMKDMYIVGGFNCYPAEIESLMLNNPALAQCAVIGVPDERMGEVGVAFVVPRPGVAIDEAALITWCRGQLANYKVPRRVYVVESLPQNATGKVQKFELKGRLQSLPGGMTSPR
jgi:acyl-CoA synthetase (AMP-forming)/AMP-acid ligase II